MGNFFTPWEDGVTTFAALGMNAPLEELDRALGRIKNPIVACDGIITYNAATGVLTWSGTLRFFFNASSGDAIENTAAAGNITLADNEFVYVDLVATDATVVSLQVAAITSDNPSNFITYDRLVLGYRNSASDIFFPTYLKNVQEAIVILTSGGAVTVNWDKAKVQEITLGHDVAFTLSGGKNGDRLILRLKQDETGGRVPTWPGTIRYGTAIAEITLSTDIGFVDYLGFVYDSVAVKYDLVSQALGFTV